MKNFQSPEIVGKREKKLSKWLTVVERDVLFPDSSKRETYHSVRPYDYVSILAMTIDHRIPLVLQYRPVLEKESLELPGGLIDTSKTPEETAQIELHEETGLVAPVLELLGVLNPDPGRLDNRFYCFFASNAVEDKTAKIEKGIKLVWTDLNELRTMILNGRFNSSLQIALIAMASLRGFINGFKI